LKVKLLGNRPKGVPLSTVYSVISYEISSCRSVLSWIILGIPLSRNGTGASAANGGRDGGKGVSSIKLGVPVVRAGFTAKIRAAATDAMQLTIKIILKVRLI